jgi:hypothetical protein
VGAAVAFAVPVLVGEGLGLLVALASSPPRPSGLTFAKLGALFFYAFNHVPVAVSVEHGQIGALAGTGFQAATGVLRVTPLAGTALVLWLLARAGRRVARSAGSGTGAWHGAKVAVPYAILCGLAGLALRVSIPLAGGTVRVAPSAIGAFVWPAILAVAAGAIGAAGAAGKPGRWLRTVRDGLRTLAVALLLAVVGLALLAPANPRATAAYFDPFHAGAAEGLTRVALTASVLPNLGLWVLFPSMGGCLTLSAQQASGGFTVCLLSYSQFPPAGGIGGVANRSPGFDLPPPPASDLLFVLVPLIAVLVGGWLAAGGRDGTRSAPRAVRAGVGFAVAAVVFGYLSRAGVAVSGRAGGSPETVAATLGPELLVGALVAVAWGIGGGLAGAALRRRRAPRSGGPSTESVSAP